MWKILLAFAVFSALAIFVLMQGGDIDMGGEKHGVEAPAAAPETTPAPAASAGK